MKKNIKKTELKEMVEDLKLRANIEFTNQLLKASIKMNGYNQKKLAKKELKMRLKKIDQDAEDTYNLLKF